MRQLQTHPLAKLGNCKGIRHTKYSQMKNFPHSLTVAVVVAYSGLTTATSHAAPHL